MAHSRSTDLTTTLDEAPLSRTHLRAVLVSGTGFFTDAYDLFIIGIAATLIKEQWHLGSSTLGLLNSMTLAASFLGAFVFGRIADVLGRKRVYWLVAAIMVVGALASAIAPNLATLVAARFVLGLGIGGDYPVSAVLMSEYSNRKDRGKLVSMVFSTQALGLIVGPLVALALLGSGTSHDLAWRIMLGLGAIPAAAVLYVRRRLPESPRFQAWAQASGNGQANGQAGGEGRASGNGQAGGKGRAATASRRLVSFRGGTPRASLRDFLTSRKNLILLAGTAGTWFIFDYAYYGNTISTPQILKLVSPHASLIGTIALQLLIFVVAALPGYVLAIARMDRIGHRRLQWIGFVAMATCFAVIGLVPGVSTAVAPFLIAYGLSYFFAEFGPNSTTFVLPAELFPVHMRATAHGISSGVAKFGAFLGVFLFPLLQPALGLRGTLTLTAGLSLLGALLTLVLPEPAGRSLDDIAGDEHVIAAAERVVAEASLNEASLNGGTSLKRKGARETAA